MDFSHINKRIKQKSTPRVRRVQRRETPKSANTQECTYTKVKYIETRM